jgi:hypothetical protein
MHLTRKQVRTVVEEMPSYQRADKPQRRAIVNSIFEAVKYCNVCGEPSVAFGPFIPERDSSDAIFRTGIPDGKHLIFWCGLCLECWGIPKATPGWKLCWPTACSEKQTAALALTLGNRVTKRTHRLIPQL